MQIGQNSTAAEKSLPQLGQVRWDSEFMDLTAVQPQFDPKATPQSTEFVSVAKRRPVLLGRSSGDGIRLLFGFKLSYSASSSAWISK
jgi:hypothetical protein